MMADYRLVVIDEILPKSARLTADKLRLIWASRVRCRRLCGYMSPSGDHPMTTAGGRLSVRTYCEVRNYGGKGPGELVFESVRHLRHGSKAVYRVRRPLTDECLAMCPDFGLAVRIFLEAINGCGFNVAEG